ncbi:spore coat protein CotJB [Paenibacillus doosanensis]|uniref:CotJB protein n=1 Tax=Paenibacillus konkukensis TaxID=2020716 RepID=A0ABY4RN93_9BACL|nr:MULTISPECIES: spore coat protein CotJB [Paenibacillus]MCS7463639.1 spore coat protein CotJB [Paenibacillus doosanensis]UQZ83164.1 CotJB protein [Paenibacillus konkukensis]
MEERQVPERYYVLLQELQAIDFVLVELTLYLDTHPLDGNALNQYNHCASERMRLAQQFEMEFGPLQSFGRSYSRYPWQWNDTPWPWQV